MAQLAVSTVEFTDSQSVVFIFVLLGKNIGRQTATRTHEQKA